MRTFGGQHALIHPSIPIVANVGYLIDDAVYHPGDSFIVPPSAVETAAPADPRAVVEDRPR